MEAGATSSRSAIPDMSTVSMATSADDAKAVREAGNYNVNVKEWVEGLPLEKARNMAKLIEENKKYMKSDNTIRKYIELVAEYEELEVLQVIIFAVLLRVFLGGLQTMFGGCFGGSPNNVWKGCLEGVFGAIQSRKIGIQTMFGDFPNNVWKGCLEIFQTMFGGSFGGVFWRVFWRVF